MYLYATCFNSSPSTPIPGNQFFDRRGMVPSFEQDYLILGLNLPRLLVQNRIAEFHTELEPLPPAAHDRACIKHAVELEQSLMEGSYNRFLSARQVVEAKKILMFASDQESLAYILDDYPDCETRCTRVYF